MKWWRNSLETTKNGASIWVAKVASGEICISKLGVTSNASLFECQIEIYALIKT